MLESRKKIDIPLKQIANSQRGSIAGQARDMCENEYATRYLESIGVQAGKEYREMVLNNLPLERALVVPVWTSGSIVIVPERRDEKDATTIKHLCTGTKELDKSRRSKKDNFFGKGVSAPGTKPRPATSGSSSLSVTFHDYSQSKRLNGDDATSPSIHVSFPVDGFIPGQEACTKLFRKMIKPLAVSDVRLKMAVKSFSMALSNFVPQIFDDPTGQLNMTIQKFIAAPVCRRLYGLLCHHVFWNIVHPFAHKVILACRKQFPKLIFTMGRTNSAMAFGNEDSMTRSRRDSMLNLTSPTFHASDEVNRDEIRTFESAFSSDDYDLTPTRTNDDSDHEADVMQELVGGESFTLKSHPYPVEESICSTESLSCEEKEMLYVQLEDCVSQMYALMGFKQHALKCCQQTLVSACHYIVHDIMCAHYSWLDEKREEKAARAQDKSVKSVSTKGSKIDHHQNRDEPLLTKADQRNIKSLQKGVVNSICTTLTELLDPARVYASKISKAMFNGEDITLREVTVKPKEGEILHGQLKRVRESKDAHRKGKFTATSLAINAVFSNSCSSETRKFLHSSGESVRPKALSRLGKGKKRSDIQEITSLTESSQASFYSGSNISYETSLEFSLAKCNSKKVASRHDNESVRDFKTMLAETGIDPLRRSKLGFTEVTVDPVPKLLSPELKLQKKATKELVSSKNSCVRNESYPNKSKKKTKDDQSYLSTEAKARLMTLAVGRSKCKYKPETILQNSSHPNAKYRKDLLSTGGNNRRLL